MSAVSDLGTARTRRFDGLKKRAARHRSWTIVVSMAVVGAILPVLAYIPPFTSAQPPCNQRPVSCLR